MGCHRKGFVSSDSGMAFATITTRVAQFLCQSCCNTMEVFHGILIAIAAVSSSHSTEAWKTTAECKDFPPPAGNVQNHVT